MKVLLVEDDASLREGMVELIAELAEVRAAGTEAGALAALDAERFDLVMTDLCIAGGELGGRTVLEAARKRQQAVAIVSASTPEDVSRVLRPHEPDAVLTKPFQLEEMLGLVERFLALHREVEGLAASRALPPESDWREVAPGVRVAPGSAGRSAWVRMAPGGAFSWQVQAGGREGVLLLEGDLEVEGERHAGPRYLFLGAGRAPAVSSREGCLAVTLGLKG